MESDPAKTYLYMVQKHRQMKKTICLYQLLSVDIQELLLCPFPTGKKPIVIQRFHSRVFTHEGEREWEDVLMAKIASLHFCEQGLQVSLANASPNRVYDFSCLLEGFGKKDDYECYLC